MKRAALIIFSLMLTLAAASAQNSWTNHYSTGSNPNQANAIAVDGSGNLFVTGYSWRINASISSDYATIKYSNAGVPLWTNRYNGPADGRDEATAMALDSNGNAFVTGTSIDNFSAEDYATIKYSNDGVPLWTNCYKGPGNNTDQANAIVVDGNGDVFVTGSSRTNGDFVSITSDYATVKYSNTGVPLWTNLYNGPGNGGDEAYAIGADNTGNVFVTGYSTGSGSSSDYATIKYSNDGVPLWTNRYNGPGNGADRAYAIAVDNSGNVFVTGSSTGSGSGLDYATIKYSNNGGPLWTNRYNGAGASVDVASAIAVDANGSVFVTGNSMTIKYSHDGVPLWTNRNSLGGIPDVWIPGIALDVSGNVFATGERHGGGDAFDYLTIKYSNSGVPLWTNRFSGPGNNVDAATAIAVDDSGNVFVTGRSYYGAGSASDYVTIKYAAVPTALENPQASTGEFSFDLVAEPGGQFAIQVSTNLVDWVAIRQVMVPAAGRTNIVETLAPSPTQKFFRAQRQ